MGTSPNDFVSPDAPATHHTPSTPLTRPWLILETDDGISMLLISYWGPRTGYQAGEGRYALVLLLAPRVLGIYSCWCPKECTLPVVWSVSLIMAWLWAARASWTLRGTATRAVARERSANITKMCSSRLSELVEIYGRWFVSEMCAIFST